MGAYAAIGEINKMKKINEGLYISSGFGAISNMSIDIEYDEDGIGDEIKTVYISFITGTVQATPIEIRYKDMKFKLSNKLVCDVYKNNELVKIDLTKRVEEFIEKEIKMTVDLSTLKKEIKAIIEKELEYWSTQDWEGEGDTILRETVFTDVAKHSAEKINEFFNKELTDKLLELQKS